MLIWIKITLSSYFDSVAARPQGAAVGTVLARQLGADWFLPNICHIRSKISRGWVVCDIFVRNHVSSELARKNEGRYSAP